MKNSFYEEAMKKSKIVFVTLTTALVSFFIIMLNNTTVLSKTPEISQGTNKVTLEPLGSLVMVGGAFATSNSEVYEKYIELAGGKDKAKIGIVPAASSKPFKNANLFKSDLVSYGVPEANIEIIPLAVKDDSTTKDVDESTWVKNGTNPEVVSKIKDYTGIWFIGGDQLQITKTLLQENSTPTPALEAIWDIYAQGAVIGGSSAGAAIMSEVMNAAGDSLGALRDGFTTEYSGMDQQEFGPLFLSKGFGFFSYGIVDQHFDRKARSGRLIVACYANKEKYPKGFGIDENTALVVDNVKKTAQVLGRGGVTIVDVSKATKTEKGKLPEFKNISVSFLFSGDQYDLAKGEYIVDPKKSSTIGEEYLAVPDPFVTGVLSSNAVLDRFLSYDLIDNSLAQEAISYLFDKNMTGFELLFRKTKDSQGYWKTKDGQIDSYSVLNVMLDIKPIKVEIKPI